MQRAKDILLFVLGIAVIPLAVLSAASVKATVEVPRTELVAAFSDRDNIMKQLLDRIVALEKRLNESKEVQSPKK